MKIRTRNNSAATAALPAALTLLLFALATPRRHVDGLKSEELKPCFERYDGHKLFGATPFHSEWRMKREVDCLPFCIRASSRCSSIVYDKLGHICYYFTVNGIAVESIERNSRMVYLQVAERRCVDEMLVIMDAEEREQPQQMYVVNESATPDSQQLSTASPRQPQFYVRKDDYGKKIDYGFVAAQVGVNASESTTVVVPEVTSIVTSEAVETTPIIGSSSASPEVVNYGRNATVVSLNVGFNQLPVVDSELGPTQMTINRPEDVQFLASELPEVVLAETIRVPNISAESTVEPSRTEEPLATINTIPPPVTVPHLVVPTIGLDVLAMPALLPVMNVFKATRREGATFASGDAQPPSGPDQSRFIGSGPLPPAASAASTDDLEEQLWRSFHVSNDVRRHPQQEPSVDRIEAPPVSPSSPSYGIYPLPELVVTTVLPVVVSTWKMRSTEATSTYTAQPQRHMVDQDFDDALESAIVASAGAKSIDSSLAPSQPPQVERLPPASSEESNSGGSEDVGKVEDGAELTFELDGVDQSCNSGADADVNQVWLAVENAQFRGSLSKSVQRRIEKFNRKSQSPKECMNECATKTMERTGGASRACDSFTYFESTRHCAFDAVGSALPRAMIESAAVGHENDFTLRAFHRFCYSSNLTPFANCAEFLAFRDYTLDIEPRESFTGLPTGRDGISACVELCVLSSEFLCQSAQFDWSAGACQLFDEHSLSMPSAFKEHRLADQLYFENGCADGEVPQEIKMRTAVAAHRSRKSVVITPTAKRMTRRHIGGKSG